MPDAPSPPPPSPSPPARPAVLFDLDGTLVDSFDDLVAAARVTLASLGLPPPTRDDVRRAIGRGLPALITGILPPDRADALHDVAIATFRAWYAEHLADHTRPYPGVEAVLEALAADGVALAVMTNKPEAFARRLVDALGLGRWLPVVVGGDSAPAPKPDPRAMRLPLARLEARGGPVRPVALVGDSAPDREGARALGIPLVAVTWGHTAQGAWRDLAEGDRVVDDAPALLAALRALVAHARDR